MATRMSKSSAAPWKQLLLTALESNSHLKHTNFFQLATVGTNGRPSNRTVVFRGFLENTDNIQINTDCRSAKVVDLKHCPFGEACWYFTDSWEQFRINGSIEFIDGSNCDPTKLQQREKAWCATSLKSRIQYLGSAPGLPCICDETNTENNLDPSTGPVDAFCLLIFDPLKVDYLNLKGNERILFTATQTIRGHKNWTLEKINP